MFFPLFFLFFLPLLVPTALAAPPESTAERSVRAALTALLAEYSGKAKIGLVVENLNDGTRWFEHEPRRPLKPASVLKLFVTAAALERFGPEFHYETRLYASNDELWVIGAGDPGPGDERLCARANRAPLAIFDDWAAALQARGIRSLQTIVLDDSIFDQEWRHADWPPEQVNAWYEAPVGGLNFNDNCLDSSVGLRNGKIELTLLPPLPPDFIHNQLTRGRKHGPRVTRAAASDIFEFRGSVARAADFGSISVHQPTIFFGYALKQALETRGIEVRGQVVRRRIAPEAAAATPLATHATRLRDALWRCNTFSQNLFAECLLKSLAAYSPDGRRSGQTGSWAGGAAQMKTTLEKLGLDLDGAIFRDGSGLSHQNRVTADQIVNLLKIMAHHRHADVFLQSLAAAGEDGSMRRRFSDPALRGRLRGKTGSLRGVHNVAGYVTRPDGARLAFALLLNDAEAEALPVRVCKILATGGAETGR